jgi:tetratricopeptide (TPR) repeat protein
VIGDRRSVTASRRLRAWLCVLLLALAAPARADEDAKAIFDRGTALFALHHFAEAAAAYEKAFELRPDPAILYNAAQAHRLAGNRTRALHLYQSLLRVYGNRIANRAEVAAHIRQLEEAASDERAAAPPPAEAAARQRFDAGNSDYAAGRYEDALRELKDGYALVPNPKFLLNLHQTYRKLGRFDEARDAMRQYVDTLAPDDPRRRLAVDARATSRRHERVAGVVLLAGGVALVATGGALTGVAVHDNGLLANPPPGWVFDPDVASQRDTFYPTGLTLLGFGTASLAAGLGALVHGMRAPAGPSVDTALAPDAIELVF